jgi:C-terminal processing protease CtpA/Prc
VFVFLICGKGFSQTSAIDYSQLKFSADTVKKAIDDLTLELSLKHPGFYRYTSKDEFRKFNDSIKSTFVDSLTELESYLKLKAVVGKIHCLHTGITLPAEYVTYLNNQPNLIPLQIWFKNNRAFIVKNISGNDSLLPGDEIISINRHSVEQILNQLLALIPSDGFNLTLKYRALYLQFPTWYRLMDAEEKFTVVVSRKGLLSTVELTGEKYNQLACDGFLKEPVRPKQLEFRIDGQTAVLTIHSFAKTNIEKGGQHFRPFIEDVFSELERNHIQQLIVDLRDNTGGSDPNAVFFTSYFFDKPFRFWDRIEVTEAIAKQIKGPKLKAFYRVPVQKNSIWLWQKGRFTNEFDFYTEQLPAKKPWRGKTYILMNGFCMSSCADVIAVLSYNKKAIFIGEETGGAYEGNNSGMIPETSVDPFHFTLTVPLQKFYNAVDLSNRQGRGVLPDYTLDPDLNDIIGGEDLYMKKLMELTVTGTSRKHCR